jgi:hypothetical protein
MKPLGIFLAPVLVFVFAAVALASRAAAST